MRNKLKTLVALLLILATLAMLAGCAKKPIEDPSTPSSETPESTAPQESPEEQLPKQLDSLTVAISADENTLTPITYVSGSPGFDIMKFMYDSLFAISAENTVIPWMVGDDFEVSSDYKEYKMTLLDGQRWHDGTELTAEDVVFTFEYFKNTFTHGRWTPISSKVDTITSSGNEITITLTAPDPGFLRSGLADVRIIPKSAFDGVEDPTTVPNMGSGAYKVTEYKVGEFYTLEAMSGYFRGEPRVKTIRMPIMTDANVTQQALISGEIAASTRNLSPELVDAFAAAPDIHIESTTGYVSSLLIFDNENPPFDNAEFRKAISRAIDINIIIDQVFLGYAARGSLGYVREGLPEYVAGLDHIYDIAEANSILDSIGYTEKDASGMRLALDGSAMTLEIASAASSTQRIRMAEIIAQQLKEIGLNVTVAPLDNASDIVWPEMNTALPRKYDMAMFGWSAPVIQRSGTIIGACSSDFAGAGGQNLPHYVSADFDALATEFQSTFDADERTRLNAEMQKIVAEDSPFVTLAYADTICAVNTKMYDGWVFAKGTNAVNLYSFLDMNA